MPNLHLIVHNIISVVAIILMFGLSLFTYLNGRKNPVNVSTSLLLFSAFIFVISHTIGVNVSDPILSRDILMFNLITFVTGALQIHSALSIVGKNKTLKPVVVGAYLIAFGFIAFFLWHPDLFLLASAPKMYFPNYYVPGSLNILRLVFMLVIALPYSVFVLIRAKYESAVPMEKNQYLYMAASVAVTYAILFIPNFLVYDIEVDPLWGMFFAPLMLIPFLYGSVKYEMLNVRIVAKQAFFFALAVAGVGGIITLFNYSNVWIQQLLPAFPLWVTAFISAVLTVSLSVIIWQKLRKDDLLKYEFITTVTHKFRTPLTHIKWSAENLTQMSLPPEAGEQLSNIATADSKLVELTNLLVSVNEADQNAFEYRMERTDMSSVAQETIDRSKSQIGLKHIKLDVAISPSLFASCDDSRIRFVMQTLVENAVSYTKEGGSIAVRLIRDESGIVFSVADSGIGMSKEELSFLFTKFYRGSKARLEDTEGMGIGLYMCKDIIAKHGGKIWAQSEGTGKGSTFSFSLPALS